MKYLIVLLLVVFQFCSKPKALLSTRGGDIKVLSINKDASEIGIIFSCLQGDNNIYLVTYDTIPISDCIKPIIPGDNLKIELIRQQKIKIANIYHKLYEGDEYVNGKLVIKDKIDVYTSPNISGLCLIK